MKSISIKKYGAPEPEQTIVADDRSFFLLYVVLISIHSTTSATTSKYDTT